MKLYQVNVELEDDEIREYAVRAISAEAADAQAWEDARWSGEPMSSTVIGEIETVRPWMKAI